MVKGLRSSRRRRWRFIGHDISLILSRAYLFDLLLLAAGAASNASRFMPDAYVMICITQMPAMPHAYIWRHFAISINTSRASRIFVRSEIWMLRELPHVYYDYYAFLQAIAGSRAIFISLFADYFIERYET